MHALAGVGENLHDHPAFGVRYQGSEALVEAMRSFSADHWTPDEQTIAKARSRSCTQAFDLHIYPVSLRESVPDCVWGFNLTVAALTPRSRGCLRLRSSDPLAAPVIDSGYFTDDGGADLALLLDGIGRARELAAQPALARLAGRELSPGPDLTGRAALARFVQSEAEHYYHPVGTCRMGRDSDALAVVDERGRVHGLQNCYVADASIMPVVPRANTNLPALVVGERVAQLLIKRLGKAM